jgi:hypothetical protein
MRELGLVTIFWDGNFSSVQTLFDATGTLVDQAYRKRINADLSRAAVIDFAKSCPHHG